MRYYFYAADLYYYDAAAGSSPVRVGDYQGVYEADDDALSPSQTFGKRLEELRAAGPSDLGANGYYHVTQFNNVT